ncbi:MAG TPA: hypothetical protein VHO06_08105 [Polyangia bacterium]|nr:hypothetical protein [Polyangia bacterium]
MTRARRRRVTWLGLVVALGAGCAVQKQVRVDFSETPRDYLAGDYQGVYERWTRHDFASHDVVDKALEVWATFKSWDFREAYIEKYAAIYNLSDAERNKLRQGQRDAYHAAYEFRVTAQSANWDWNDLDKRNTAWVVTLVDALGHELPSERVTIDRLPDAAERVFYPSKTPFSKSYSIRFLMPAQGGEFDGVKSGAITLRIASPIGKIELVWKS